MSNCTNSGQNNTNQNQNDPNNVTLFVLQALKQEGIDHIFLVPGTTLAPFLPNFSKAGISAIVTAHEAGAAFMADGFARARGGFGVCMGIGGPGITNMITAISAAYFDRSPVLVVGGVIESEWQGDGAFQDASPTGIDEREILRPITVWAERVPLAEKVGDFLQKAIRAMLGVENRPAFISIPRDIQQKPVPAKAYKPLRLQEPARILDQKAVKQLPDILRQATRITILAGNGCVRSGAGEEIQKFAKKYSIPIVTTLRAKGAISEDHPLSFGFYGSGGSLQANKVVMGWKTDNNKIEIPNAEVLLVLGATLNQNNTYSWNKDFVPSQSLVRVDINPNIVSGKNYQETFINGDVKELFHWLHKHENLFDANLKASKPQREEWLQTIRQTPYYDYLETQTSDTVPMHPAQVIAELRKAAPRNTAIVADSGAHTFFVGHYWKSYAPNECLTLTTSGPMGYGVALGVGAKFARPLQPCVAVVGDGGMLMHGIEIQTAARYKVPLIVVVINNSGLGNVYIHVEDEGPKALELTELPTHNWVDFARSLGGDGIVVEYPDKLAEAFKCAFASNVPFVVDARCCLNAKLPNEPSGTPAA
ncbi:thiamine pyrophosphate-binding protein [Microcoleus sp. N3A4]|uniref:thiamine pyrophosphate-binding protein n=1 Tax=Microcoleus sp. N3A4 TaxID=3055379 RepID=UPI002FD63092